jgi:hypothetical protein
MYFAGISMLGLGHRGAALSVPSWRDIQVAFEPFPVGWRSNAVRVASLMATQLWIMDYLSSTCPNIEQRHRAG